MRSCCHRLGASGVGRPSGPYRIGPARHTFAGHRTHPAPRPLAPADLTPEIEESPVERRIRARRASEAVQIQSQLKASCVLMSGQPSRDPRRRPIQQYLATSEAEREHSGADPIAHAGKSPKVHIVPRHLTTEPLHELVGDLDQNGGALADTDPRQLCLGMLERSQRRRARCEPLELVEDRVRLIRARTRQQELPSEDEPRVADSTPRRAPSSMLAMPRQEPFAEALAPCAPYPPRLFQCLSHRTADHLPEQHRHRVSDLSVSVAGAAGEPEVVGKTLYAGRLPDREGPMLIRMYVPVAVLCDVGCDRPAQLGPAEPLVLIGEHVRPVAAEALGQIDIGLSFREEAERFHIIGPDIAAHVLAYPADLRGGHLTAHELLKRRALTARIVGKTLPTLCARNRRQITDRVTKAHEVVRRLGPTRRPVPVDTDQDQPLSMLRNTMSKAIQNPRLDPVAQHP
jgi:hypothetical protein